MSNIRTVKPIYYNPTNEEIEAMPEVVRQLLSLEVYHKPTLKDFIADMVESMESGSKFNIKDIQLYLWKFHPEATSNGQALVLGPTIHPVMIAMKKTVGRVKDKGLVTYTKL